MAKAIPKKGFRHSDKPFHLYTRSNRLWYRGNRKPPLITCKFDTLCEVETYVKSWCRRQKIVIAVETVIYELLSGDVVLLDQGGILKLVRYNF